LTAFCLIHTFYIILPQHSGIFAFENLR